MLPDGVVQRELLSSTSCSVATAVNILFIDPMRNLVSGVLGVPTSRFSRPQALRSKSFPSRAT